MLTLSENPQEALTNSLWQKWKDAGYTEQPNALTWMEVSNLVKFYLKICRQTEQDYRDFDFENLLDHKLTYYENLSQIENTVGHPEEAQEQEALSELNAKLQQDYGITVNKNLKPTTELEQTNKDLKNQNRKISAQLETALKDKADLEQKLKHPTEPQIIVKEVPVIKEVQVIKEVIRELPPPPPPMEQYICIRNRTRKEKLKIHLTESAKQTWRITKLLTWNITN